MVGSRSAVGRQLVGRWSAVGRQSVGNRSVGSWVNWWVNWSVASWDIDTDISPVISRSLWLNGLRRWSYVREVAGSIPSNYFFKKTKILGHPGL